ncbi:glutamate dehydrogenase [Ruegeria marisrubri]|uniref:Glutamate dehydrogenase n=1 Tax=Ruegeria marisrubri TaxID=1685379 RepID=A0A0X3UBM7_9RHOB|nr:Glu/Leu/Phe/Val dehydrogenase [Ruegeria marisrubri]KUJ85493.1 glutamate dehydrogenase [Ruegeria marisrubri]
MTDLLSLADDLGPGKIVHVRNPAIGLQAIVVIDNVAAGPSIGGVRMANDVTLEECARLARAMTLKNAAAGLPHGGGKAVIVGDPAMAQPDKEILIRAFANAIQELESYVPGPDMGTNETCMAWVREETGRAVGLPALLGGIPLDEIGATGFGLTVAAETAQDISGVSLSGARVSIQGFGAVGRHAARFLAARGARQVAVSDTGGTILDPEGLPLDELENLKRHGQSVTALRKARIEAAEAALTAECDILIPAARPDAIHAGNADAIKARLVLEGANIPATPEAEAILRARGILVVPDFIANAGGVICAAVELRGGGQEMAFQVIEERIRRNTREVLERARSTATDPRAAANAMAEERVRRAMALRRFS